MCPHLERRSRLHRPPPRLNFIRSFESAARHLSFTRAAQELGYTQAAISTHVRALEDYVGHALFVRNARSLQLTEVGAAFLPTLRQGLAQIDSATDAIVTSARDRRVIIACPMSLAENWLPGCLATFQALHPDAEVVVHGHVWEDTDDRTSDLAISVNRQDDVPPGAHPLWRESLSLLCAPSLVGAIQRPADLIEMNKIVISGRQECWTLMGAALGQVDLTKGSMFRTNAWNISLEMAAQALGVTVAPTSLCGIYVARGLLSEPFEVRPPSSWTYCVSNRSGARGTTADRLMAHIIACGQGLGVNS